MEHINVGDRIFITICDCGIGHATVLEKTEHDMKIEVEKDTWTCCYDCQSLLSNVFRVNYDDIAEVSRC